MHKAVLPTSRPRKHPGQAPVACFGPALSDKRLKELRALLDSGDFSFPEGERVKDAYARCLACVEAWWKLPESDRHRDKLAWNFDVPARDGGGKVLRGAKGAPVRKPVQVEEIPLPDEQVDALWEVTPWMDELLTYSGRTDDLPDGRSVVTPGLLEKAPAGPVRDAFGLLIWYAKEICLDREPMTQDRLTPGK